MKVQDVARFYTRARRIPILIGKLPDGQQIPFGPFTIGQVLCGAGTAVVLWKTYAVWTRDNLIFDAGIFVAVFVATVIVTGKLPTIGRNPLSWAYDAAALAFKPSGGTRNGRALTVRPPHRISHRIVTATMSPAAAQSAASPKQPSRPAVTEVSVQTVPAVPAAAPQPANIELTGVGRLLAGSITGKDPHA